MITKTVKEYGQIAFTNDSWNAGLDKKKVELALVCETYNMRDIEEGHDNDIYPVIMECSVITHPKSMSKKYKSEAKQSMCGDSIFDLHSYGGGIPVTDFLEGTKSSAKSNVDNEVRTQKHATFGNPIKVRHFKDEDNALQYADDVYKHNATALFGLIGFTLDKAVNRMGTTGWEIIEHQATGKELY